jgi:hypothetical protein
MEEIYLVHAILPIFFALGRPSGKLGQTSTIFEVKCRKLARNIGIDHSSPEKAAPEADCCAPFL